MSDGSWRMYMSQPSDPDAHFVAGEASLCGLEGAWGRALKPDDGTDPTEPCPMCWSSLVKGEADE